MSLKYSLKHRRKLLALLAISLFIGSICTPVFLFSQTSNNYLTNLLILDGKSLTQSNHSAQKQEQSWLSGWDYRKSHTIVGSTTGGQTDYQMRITVHYGSGSDSGENVYCNFNCRTDFGDIRFTKSNGATLLDYWLEDKIDGDRAIFWVEIDNIPASPGIVDIYIYYGKSDATTASNGDNTFIFFDDFPGSSYNTSKWDEQTDPNGNITISNSEADMVINSGTDWVGLVTDNSYTKSTCVVETKAKGVSDGGSSDVQSPLLCLRDVTYGQSITWSDTVFFIGVDYIRHSWYDGVWHNDDFYSTTQPTTFKIFQIIKNGSSFSAKYLNLDYSEIASSNGKTVSDFSFYIDLRTARPSECKYDWVRVRNYVNPEPIHGSWGIEEPTGWLSGWSYRKSHTIVGSTAGAQTNYQMRITVHYGNGTDIGENVYCDYQCKADFGDIRFTKSDGITLLDYWLEDKADGDKATFWVEIDSIPASPSTVDIYVYYGKSDSSTTSNGDNTFLFFDDFDDNILDTYKWPYHDGEWSERNQRLEYSGTGKSRIESSYTTDNNIPVVIELKGYWESGTYWEHNILVHFGDTNNYQGTQLEEKNEQLTMGKRVNGVWSSTSSTPFTYSQDTWYDIKSVIKGGQIFESHIDSTSVSGSYTERSSGRFVIRAEGSLSVTCYYDNVKIRRYANPEPTHGAWGNEEQLVIWNDTTITDTQIVKNKYIVLNGNLTIASGGSLTLTDVILRVNCTLNGSNRIEVQNGGVLYINDTDGNPNTRNDATNITAHNSNYRFLFWVKSGATFHMNNSELHYCGYNHSTGNFGHFGLWINTNNTIIENNRFTNNFFGIVLHNAHNNILRNNNAKNNSLGFFINSSSNNIFTGNTAGFSMRFSSYNNLTGNTAINNAYGFVLYEGSNNNNVTSNAAINNYYGFRIDQSSNNNLTGNTALNCTYGFYLGGGSSADLTDSIVANYLRIEVLCEGGGAVQGAEIMINVDGNPIYASLGYGGNNSTTDQNGLTDWIVVPYRTFISGAWMDNTTNVTVSFFELTIPNNPREVNMSSSHTETFVVEMIETTFTIDIVAGPDKYVDASAQTGVELILNITAPVKLSIIKTINTLGGGAPSGLNFLGRFVSIEVNDTIAVQGIRIIMHYTDQEVSGINLDENSIAIWYWNETFGNWIQLESYINMVNNLVAANTTHLTHFALLGSLMPSEPPISPYPPYLLYILYYLFTSSGINPEALILVISWVAIALVVLGIALWRRREEEAAPEIRAPAQISSDQLRPAQEWIVSARNIRCSLCGADIPENCNFCIYCGGAISRCSVCNLEIVSRDRIVSCPHCGAQSHRDHLLEWIKVKGICPVCKERLNIQDIL
ncbi:MAG: DUF2341 domain-containing protein [Candidatus Lokiarchaeia archaeon]